MEEFIRHCKTIKELIEAASIVPHVVNANLIRFRYDDEFISSYAEKEKIDERAFRTDLREIPMMMLAALSDNTALLMRYLLDDELSEEEAALERKKIEDKVQVVEQEFIDARIGQIYKLKSTAKTNLLRSIEWEINEKIFDRESRDLKNLRYAQLQLGTSSKDAGMPFFSIVPFFTPNEKHDVLLTLTYDDVEYMISELESLKRVLDIG